MSYQELIEKHPEYRHIPEFIRGVGGPAGVADAGDVARYQGIPAPGGGSRQAIADARGRAAMEETTMKEPRFSPGPWEVRGGRGCTVVTVAAGIEICTCAFHSLACSEEQVKANAHLIAKSPELYERLDAIEYAFQFALASGAHTRLEILLRGIPQLLAEARGESL